VTNAAQFCGTLEEAFDWLEETRVANRLMDLELHPSREMDAAKHCSTMEAAMGWLEAAGDF